MPQMHGLPLGGGGRRQVGSQLREFFRVEIEGLVDIVSDDPQLFVEIGQALGYAAQRSCRALVLGLGQRLVDGKFGNQLVAKKNRIVVALCRGRRIRARTAVSIGHEGRTDAEAAPRAILADPLRIIARKIEIGVVPPIAVGAVRCDQRHLVMIKELIEIHVHLPFSGSALVSQSPASERTPTISWRWGSGFSFTREGVRPRACRLAMLRIDSGRSEEPKSEIQSLMRISYAVFC